MDDVEPARCDEERECKGGEVWDEGEFGVWRGESRGWGERGGEGGSWEEESGEGCGDGFGAIEERGEMCCEEGLGEKESLGALVEERVKRKWSTYVDARVPLREGSGGRSGSFTGILGGRFEDATFFDGEELRLDEQIGFADLLKSGERLCQ